MSARVTIHRPASWRGDDPDGPKGRDAVPWVCVRADTPTPDPVREAAEALASKWATGSSNDLSDDTYQRAFNAARYRCSQELRAALSAPSPSPAAPHAADLALMAKGIDEECCCVACGREVAPSPCCPDYPVWPGPCRSCYEVPAAPYTRCDACGGLGGMHVEGKRGFDRFPCPNANAAPERGGEPVAWGIAAADGTVVETYLFKIRADRMAADLNSTHDKCGPFRVVALVTRESHRESPSEEQGS